MVKMKLNISHGSTCGEKSLWTPSQPSDTRPRGTSSIFGFSTSLTATVKRFAKIKHNKITSEVTKADFSDQL